VLKTLTTAKHWAKRGGGAAVGAGQRWRLRLAVAGK